MRDLVLREGLKTMAGDASLRLRDLLASGVEIPYEVREAGDGSPLAEYIPQTSRFIRESSSELCELDSFGTACAALESGGLAASYLQEMGVPEPGDLRRRAELAGVVFLCRLWQGSTDFTLDDVRLAATVEELLDSGEAALGEVEIAVPLRGFQMAVERLELAGATIVRSDTVDVPAETRGGDGMGGAAWEPTYLVVARVEALDASADGSDLPVQAVAAFKRVVTTLHLFKAGGVALGPHAWVKAGGDRWRRISTGSGKPRPGGYRLADTELAGLADLSRGLAHSSTPFARAHGDSSGFPATLTRALSRFEAGLERAVTLEALNDYLLTLRFLLEGGGPASLGMSMRVAALCAEPDHRTEVKALLDRGVALERELWSGEPAFGYDRHRPADVAAEIEDMARAILRDAALGHLGSELRITADEILLGEGLTVGEGAGAAARGETAEWDPTYPADSGEFVEQELGAEYVEEELVEQELEAELEEALEGRRLDTPTPEADAAYSQPKEPTISRAQNMIHDLALPEPEFEWSEPAPRDERHGRDERHERDEMQPDALVPHASAELRVLRAVPDEGPVAALIADSDNHRREVANRVSFLFPPPDTTEWSVREVGYDRTRRAHSSADDPATHAS